MSLAVENFGLGREEKRKFQNAGESRKYTPSAQPSVRRIAARQGYTVDFKGSNASVIKSTSTISSEFATFTAKFAAIFTAAQRKCP